MDLNSVRELNSKIEQEGLFLKDLRAEINKVMVGQETLVDRVLIALLADGHILLEGVPGLAKTLLIKTIAHTIQSDFSRIQFTPDLLPADLIGTQIYSPKTGEFTVHRGPVFANLILADEINRAPGKVQSALLEAMQERQITIGNTTYPLNDLFLVLATQNPVEQEGTYPLPEAQVDRFMLKVLVDYPSRAEERIIMDRMTGSDLPKVRPIITPEEILQARAAVRQIYVDDKIKEYILDLVLATRNPGQSGLRELQPLINFGASPRATIYMVEAARAHAFLSGRGFITPEDIKQIAPPRSCGSTLTRFMLSTEIFKKIRQIEIRTRRLANDSLAGEYHAVFKGQGMEFDEVRLYQPGDEIRTIDWNVTARMGDTYVKRYVEERELTVLFVVDGSASEDFGSVDRFKRDLAAELTAVLAFAATNNNDKVGLLIFTDEIELYIPPRKGRKHVLRIVRELLAFKPKSRGTNIKLALDSVNRLLKRRSIVFLVSDFIAEPEAYAKPLAVTNRYHDLIAIMLYDPLELDMANVGLVALEDAESGQVTWVDTNHRSWRENFGQQVETLARRTYQTLRRARVDRVVVTTATDYVTPLAAFFRKRSQKMNR